MKKLFLIVALVVGTLSSYTIEAQHVNVNVSVNIGRQPAWGPVGYDYVEFYYFPDINCYYNVNLDLFYYFRHGRWIAAQYLPYAYCHHDLYGMYKVVLVNVVEPWRHNHIHINEYARYKGNRTQVVIRDSRDVRYKDSRNNKVVWHKENNTNNNHRNSNSSSYRSSDNSNNRNNNTVSGRDNNNNRNNNNVVSGRNNSSNSSNNKNDKNINNNNNNVRKNDNTGGQQKYNENRQSQRNSDSQSVSGRSNTGAGNNSTVTRSGSSGRSQESNRMASNNERRGRNR